MIYHKKPSNQSMAWFILYEPYGTKHIIAYLICSI